MYTLLQTFPKLPPGQDDGQIDAQLPQQPLFPHNRSQPKPAAPEGADYGGAAANAAAKKLQSLGCTVYPPSKKDAVDWGVLAGGQQHSHVFTPATAASRCTA